MKIWNWLFIGLLAVAFPAMAQTQSVKIFKGGVEVPSAGASVIINLPADPVAPPATSELAPGSNGGIMWGANIHSGRDGVYATLGISKVMALLNQIGLKSVRTDLYTSSAQDQAILRATLDAAKPYGIKVLPILLADISIGNYASEAAAYDFGRAMGLTYGTNFPDLTVVEVGNEWNGKIGDVSGQGSFASNYSQANLAKVRGLSRGLIEGLKAGNPKIKVAFGSNGGAAAWGWTDALWAAGVRWDITSVHFYSNGGKDDIRSLALAVGNTDLLALTKSHYGVPIWLTEFNYWEGSADDSVKAAWLANTLPIYGGFAKAYGLESAIIYEALDEAIAGAEGRFGLATGAGALKATGTALKSYLAAHPSVVYH